MTNRHPDEHHRQRLGSTDAVRYPPRPRPRTPRVHLEDIDIVPLDEESHRVVVGLLANMITKYMIANPHCPGDHQQDNIDDEPSSQAA